MRLALVVEHLRQLVEQMRIAPLARGIAVDRRQPLPRDAEMNVVGFLVLPNYGDSALIPGFTVAAH
jgi:hypothetical protein